MKVYDEGAVPHRVSLHGQNRLIKVVDVQPMETPQLVNVVHSVAAPQCTGHPRIGLTGSLAFHVDHCRPRFVSPPDVVFRGLRYMNHQSLEVACITEPGERLRSHIYAFATGLTGVKSQALAPNPR